MGYRIDNILKPLWEGNTSACLERTRDILKLTTVKKKSSWFQLLRFLQIHIFWLGVCSLKSLAVWADPKDYSPLGYQYQCHWSMKLLQFRWGILGGSRFWRRWHSNDKLSKPKDYSCGPQSQFTTFLSLVKTRWSCHFSEEHRLTTKAWPGVHTLERRPPFAPVVGSMLVDVYRSVPENTTGHETQSAHVSVDQSGELQSRCSKAIKR